MTDQANIEANRPALAANYIIALGGSDTGRFVVCEPTIVVEKGGSWGGLSPDEIEQYIRRHLLAAAPLPGRPVEAEDFRPGPGLR